MIHPSYTELMAAVNEQSGTDGEPVVTSRYSVVIAAAKRARQLVDGAPTEEEDAENRKPLSVAIDELTKGEVKIVPEDDDEDEEEEDEILDNSGSIYDFELDAESGEDVDFEEEGE
ncbi:MAG: DNA-directed RNA polymerase subunit omega [Lachnospiraceae bacterium]|nr:DNA-directed RNA polymerase subunit omega [Lachnospiraceae bacterium]